MIGQAQASDADELARLFRRNHPDIEGWLEPEVQHESQTFVVKDDEGRIIGLALVSRLAYGLYPYGVIHELEVTQGANLSTARSLVEVCLRWLAQRGTMLVYATASDDTERGLYRSLGFGQSGGEVRRFMPPRPVQAAHRTGA